MKTILFAALLCLSAVCAAQTKVTTDTNGNFVAVRSASRDSVPDKKTGKYFMVGKQALPVYISKHGKLYVIRTSKKTGKQYRQYLTVTTSK